MRLVIGGTFSVAGSHQVSNIAAWDPATDTWSALGTGVNGVVRAVLPLPNGDLIAAGSFTAAGGVAASRIARFSQGSWFPLGSGCDSSVYALARTTNGEVVAGGSFLTAGGVQSRAIARWNGTNWLAAGTGIIGDVFSLAATAAGDVVVGGWFTSAGGVAANRVARWNGVAFAPLGAGVNGVVTMLARAPGGELVVGGTFSQAGGVAANGIARWNGAAWSGYGTGSWAPVSAVEWMPNGDLIAGVDLPPGPAGAFTGIARWDGTSWNPFGGPLGAWPAVLRRVGDTVFAPGGLMTTGSQISAGLARLVTPCPAGSIPFGVACPSSGGANTLSVVEEAWIGGVVRTRSSGIPALAIVAFVSGFATTSLPLSAVFPQGQPGCDVRVMPDLLDFALATTGAAETTLPVPASASLIGQSFHHQHVPFELDASGAIVAITATNALTLTLGSW